MAEYYNNTLCVSHAELTEGIISHDNYKKLLIRKKLRHMRRASYCTPALVAFDSMPDKLKAAYVEKHGDPRRNVQHHSFARHIEDDYEAVKFFREYTFDNGRYLPEQVQKTYIANAKVLKALLNTANDRQALRRALGGSTRGIWERLAEICQELKEQLGHDLPANHRRLKTRAYELARQGYISIISGKFGNTNSSKVKDEEQEALLRQLLRKHQNFDNEQIRELYNIVAKKVGWKTITATTVANKRELWNLEILPGQRGERHFDSNVAMQVTRKAPVLPLIYWTIDGWDVELLYQKTDINTKGNTVTTYHNRPTVVIVLDPCCKYPVGFAIGTHETPELIRAAVRNAINHTAELFGRRHKVLQLQTDNYGKGTLTEFYQAASCKYTPARVKNAKAKVVEPYFAYINRKFCQLMPNWSGHNVTARKENQPNDEYLNKIRHSFPDWEGVVKQVVSVINLERSTKIQDYLESYSKLPEADRVYVSDADYYLSMGEVKTKTTRLQPAGLIFTLNKQTFAFDTFDPSFRQNAHVDWAVRYDPADMSKILVVNEDATLRFMLDQKYINSMALYDRDEHDALELEKVKQFNKGLKESIIEKTQQDAVLVDSLLQRNELEGTLTKLVLLDSNGQHKDQKNGKRSLAAANGKKMLEKQNKAEQQQRDKSWDEKQQDYLSGKVDFNKYLENI